MQVRILTFSRSPKPAVIASVRFELVAVDADDSIIVDDARILRNKHGQLWLSMPSHSVPSTNGRSYDYLPAVALSTKLKREVEDAVLPAFESWERDQSTTQSGGLR